MAYQQLRNCKITAGGSIKNVVNLNITTHSYYERAKRSCSKRRKFSSSESTLNLVLEAERLQRTAKTLSRELKLTAGSPIEYNDLAITLGNIAEETIPYILRFSLNDHHGDTDSKYRVLVEITYMQGILDDFVRKRPTNHDRAIQGAHSGRAFTVGALIDLLWSYFWWLLYAQYLIAAIRKSLRASLDRVHAALFKPLALSLSKPVRCHQIDIEDFFSAQWSLPQDLCLNRQVFLSILRLKFQGGTAELVVISEQFNVFQQNGSRAIPAANWERVVGEGDGLQLSVLVNRQSVDTADSSHTLECPQCGKGNSTIIGDSPDGWVTCLQCDSTFNLIHTDSALTSSGFDQYQHLSDFRYFSITFDSSNASSTALTDDLTELSPMDDIVESKKDQDRAKFRRRSSRVDRTNNTYFAPEKRTKESNADDLTELSPMDDIVENKKNQDRAKFQRTSSMVDRMNDTYNAHERRTKEINIDCLKYILEDPSLRFLFRNFLRGNFCEKNLLFWLDVQDFKRRFLTTSSAISGTNRSGLRHTSGQHAMEQHHEALLNTTCAVHNKYFAPASQCELNLDHDLRIEVRKYLEDIILQATGKAFQGRIEPEHASAFTATPLQKMIGLYERIQTHVFLLMAYDSVPKFIKTPEFLEMRNWDDDLDTPLRDTYY